MKSTKTIPPIVQIGSWLLNLIVFTVGFWHTHLGLKDMRPFDSEYGSIAIAAIVLLLLLITYWYAVNGRKMVLIFYVICGLFFFSFNLNYFYPSYMARTLVKEEAMALNDTLQTFTTKSASYFKSQTISELAKLYELKDKVIFEIKKDGGLGPDAKDYLNEINQITGHPTRLNGRLGNTQTDREEIASNYDTLMKSSINAYIIDRIANNKVGNPAAILDGIKELNDINEKYTDTLKKIIADDHEIKLDSLIHLRSKGANHPQIQTLQNLVTDIDRATKKINEGNKENIYPILKEAETRNLGKIKHTFNSIRKRITETDTLIIILICLFIDLLVPLAMYLLVRKNEDESESKSLQGKIKPTSF